MRITFFVNAMIVLEGQHSRVLCDPWITFDSESQSGLYNFPETRLTREQTKNVRPDFIYISHTHADHFDPITLELFDRDTPILVADYDQNFTERSARRLGFSDVRVVDSERGVGLNGDDWCWLELSAIYPEVDSIGIFRLDGKIAVNVNDNPYDHDQCAVLSRRFGPVEIACAPYCYQGPYPAFYENLTPSDKAEAAKKRRLEHYETLVRFTNTLSPKFVFAFAAGTLYGGRKATLYPYYGVGTPEEAAQYVDGRSDANVVLLSEGCSFDVETGETTGTYEARDYSTEQDYIERISRKSSIFDANGLFHIAPSEQIDLTKLLVKAREKQWGWQQRRGSESDAVYFIDIGQEDLYRLCLGDLSVTSVRESDIDDEAYEIFRMPYGLLVGLLTGHYNYSNMKTQFISFFRRPDRFDRELHVLMSFLQV